MSRVEEGVVLALGQMLPSSSFSGSAGEAGSGSQLILSAARRSKWTQSGP
jgi:hypothetical protein